MTIRIRIAAFLMAAAGAAGLGLLAAGPALAGTGPVTAVTHASQHPDTTNASGPACGSVTNGPVWAYDNLSRQFSVTSNGSGNYTVTITDHGSFAGFADPANCMPLASSGSVDGSYTLTLTSSTSPDPAGLAPQYVGEVSTMKMVQDLFDGHATNIVGGDYAYSYQHGNYVQTTQSITGDVTGH